MKIRIALATATAMSALLGAAAMADDNKAYLTQTGSTNVASVNQSAGSRNELGRAADAATQNGTSNTLTILQSGSDNKVGTAAAGTGLDQAGSLNTASITQATNFNALNQLNQNGYGSATVTQNGGNNNVVSTIAQTNNLTSVPPSNLANTLTITQAGTGNRIGAGDNAAQLADQFNLSNGISQERSNANASLAGHSITVAQTGNYNRIVSLNQIGARHTIDVTQTGNQNFLGLIDQRQYSNYDNVVTLSITGDRNGASATAIATNYLTRGSFGSGSFAAAVGLAQADIRQYYGGFNTINYTIVGDHNLFAFEQDWYDSAIGTTTGDNNQVAIHQGDANNASNFSQTGDRNDIGVKVTDGEHNDADVFQTGDDNSAWARIIGNTNYVVIDQDGDDNIANVALTGDNNGGGSFSGNAASLATSKTLSSGLIAQDGNLNNALYSATGNGNQFAYLQDGNGNSITGTVTGAGSNQAVVAQIGNTNNSVFTQNGSSNNIAISQ